MHTIIATEGIVLSKRGVQEASSSVTLLTNAVGLVRASARSARVEVSKLRYGLEPLSLGRYSLVKGKNEWRLTGVEDVSRAYIAGDTARRKLLGQVSKLLLRLMQGEEPMQKLFDTVKDGFTYIAAATTSAEAEALECVLVLRILSHLGYLPERPELIPFVGGAIFSLELAAQAAQMRTKLVRAINESLSATGL